MSEMQPIKAAYIQFCGRVCKVNGVDKHLVASALYTDKELSNIKGIEVIEMRNYELNKVDKFDTYRNRITEYAAALKLAFKYQNALIDQDYDVIVLCPSHSKLWTWLNTGKVPGKLMDLWLNINRQFASTGPTPLTINIGLSSDIAQNKAYKFCKPEYIGAELCRLKRGVHIMTRQEIEAARNKIMEEHKQKESVLLDENGVNIFDILQENQGSEFEPVIIFDKGE